ncbi:MAG TPA: hypothetical protein P5244_02815 [Syntrophales bacterium]|jgi:hypothetical protein|nr:hypothetical protein [Syntrophales bacterium]
MPKDDFNAKWLEGLTFSTSKEEKVKTDGGDRTNHVPETRPLTAADVLSWRIDGQEVVIVAADGRKHRVKK